MRSLRPISDAQEVAGQALRDSAAVDSSAAAPFAWSVLAAIGGMLATIVVVGVVAGRLGVPISPGLLISAGLAGTIPALVELVRARRSVGGADVIGVVGALTMLAAGLAVVWPVLLPPGRSVDAVHHLQLVTWIAERGALPGIDGETRGHMGEMAAYPPGFALVVTALAALLGRPVLDLLYPTAVLFGALTGGLATMLAAWSARPAGRAVVLALVTPLLLLAHRTYFLEGYIDHSYYAMIFGALLALLAGGRPVVAPRLGLLGAGQAGLALAALVGTYPHWAPIPAAMLVVCIVAQAFRRSAGGAGERRPARAVLLLLAAVLPATVLALLDLPPRLDVGRTVLEHEGLVQTPTWQSIAPLVLALAAGVVLVVGRRRLRLAGLFAIGLAAAGALWLAASVGLAAGYHTLKLLFLLTPLAAALVGAAAVEGGALGDGRRRAVALGALAAALLLAGSYRAVPRAGDRILTADLVAAARWVRAEQPEAARDALVVGGPAGPYAYWLQIGLLGQRRDEALAALAALTEPPPSLDAWALDARQPELAIAPGVRTAPAGAELLARHGDVAVLRRTGLDPQEHDPLLINYRAFAEDDRLQVALELVHPRPGPLPAVELLLAGPEGPVAGFRLQPDPARERPQYLGLSINPATLAAEGYVNRDSFPAFPPPSQLPSGALSLSLRLLLGERVVDERPLASFVREAGGELRELAPQSGELVYVRRNSEARAAAPPAAVGDAGLQVSWASGAGAAGQALPVWLRWESDRPIDRSLYLVVQLVNEAGQPVAESVDQPQGGFYPTWRWRPGEVVTEERQLPLPPDLAPGAYRLAVEIRDFGPEDGRLGGRALLGEVVVAGGE